MAYLHSLRIMHRDLKSENLLLDARNTAVVSDFGLAREKNTLESMSKAEACAGEDEQAAGSAAAWQ